MLAEQARHRALTTLFHTLLHHLIPARCESCDVAPGRATMPPEIHHESR